MYGVTLYDIPPMRKYNNFSKKGLSDFLRQNILMISPLKYRIIDGFQKNLYAGQKNTAAKEQ